MSGARHPVPPLAVLGLAANLLAGDGLTAALPPANVTVDDGGPQFVEGNWRYTSAIAASHFVEPVPALLNVSRYLRGDHRQWVPVPEQVLGYFTSPSGTPPRSYRIAIPQIVDGHSVDVDNDASADAGVQVYGLVVGSNLTGDSYLEQLDQTAYRSYLFDPATGRLREGTLLIYAPDDAQGFPMHAGTDGEFFTGDDVIAALPAGYTLATLHFDGTVTFDRSKVAVMDTREEADTASPDLSDLGLTESFNALIELLKQRYAYTELRGLDWDGISQRYLPEIEAADASDDVAAYYQTLTALALSIRDAHVFTKTEDAVIKAAYWKAFDRSFGGDLGAHIAELMDGRHIVTQVAPDSPAAQSGWQFGTEILRVDGQALAERLDGLPVISSVGTSAAARLMQLRLGLRFPEGTEVRVEFRQPDETETRLATLTAVAGLEFADAVVNEPSIAFYELADGYGYIRWDMFHDPQYTLATWEHFLRRFQGAPGIVIDMRENVGGNAELMYTMASYFFSQDEPASYHWVDNWTYDEVAGGLVKMFPLQMPLHAPRPDLRYDGAVVVLVSEKTASAGEYFPQFLQYHDRALVVGEHPSEGAGGTVEQVALPGDIKFFFTKGRTYFAGSDDPNLEAKGVTLDVQVPITQQNEQAKLADGDPVLDAALVVLTGETRKMAQARLAGTRWRLTRIFAAPNSSERFTETPDGYAIEFAEEGLLNITTDCNAVKASYVVGASGAITIKPTNSTLAACPETSLGNRFVQWLASAHSLQVSDEGLAILADPESGVVALIFSSLQR